MRGPKAPKIELTPMIKKILEKSRTATQTLIGWSCEPRSFSTPLREPITLKLGGGLIQQRTLLGNGEVVGLI